MLPATIPPGVASYVKVLKRKQTTAASHSLFVFDLDDTLVTRGVATEMCKTTIVHLWRSGQRLALASFNNQAPLFLQQNGIEHCFDTVAYGKGFDVSKVDHLKAVLHNTHHPGAVIFFDDLEKNIQEVSRHNFGCLVSCIRVNNPEELVAILKRMHKTRDNGPALRVVESGVCKEILLLPEGQEIMVGRDESNHLRITDTSCSRRHAMLTAHSTTEDSNNKKGGNNNNNNINNNAANPSSLLQGCKWSILLSDEDSTAGTYVDGKKIPKNTKIVLQTGSVLRFGESNQRYFLVEGTGSVYGLMPPFGMSLKETGTPGIHCAIVKSAPEFPDRKVGDILMRKNSKEENYSSSSSGNNSTVMIVKHDEVSLTTTMKRSSSLPTKISMGGDTKVMASDKSSASTGADSSSSSSTSSSSSASSAPSLVLTSLSSSSSIVKKSLSSRRVISAKNSRPKTMLHQVQEEDNDQENVDDRYLQYRSYEASQAAVSDGGNERRVGEATNNNTSSALAFQKTTQAIPDSPAKTMMMMSFQKNQPSTAAASSMEMTTAITSRPRSQQQSQRRQLDSKKILPEGRRSTSVLPLGKNNGSNENQFGSTSSTAAPPNVNIPTVRFSSTAAAAAAEEKEQQQQQFSKPSTTTMFNSSTNPSARLPPGVYSAAKEAMKLVNRQQQPPLPPQQPQQQQQTSQPKIAMLTPTTSSSRVVADMSSLKKIPTPRARSVLSSSSTTTATASAGNNSNNIPISSTNNTSSNNSNINNNNNVLVRRAVSLDALRRRDAAERGPMRANNNALDNNNNNNNSNNSMNDSFSRMVKC